MLLSKIVGDYLYVFVNLKYNSYAFSYYRIDVFYLFF